ncbi:MAG: AzlD domain-containing protein [Spirochaetota bacterium]
MTGNELLMILGMMGVTFGIRYFLFALADRIKMPVLMEASLKYIPPAVLIAITLPAVLLPNGEWHISFSNSYLVSAIVTAIAGVITRNLLATIAIGLLSFFVYRMLM